MTKRGRTSLAPVCTSLEDVLRFAPEPSTGHPFKVEYDGKAYYIWTTSVSNAVRLVAYGLGFKAKAVQPNEYLEMFKQKEHKHAQKE